jgi:hypothetical protein
MNLQMMTQHSVLRYAAEDDITQRLHHLTQYFFRSQSEVAKCRFQTSGNHRQGLIIKPTLMSGLMKGAVACFALKGLKSLEHNFWAQPTQITFLKILWHNPSSYRADANYCFFRLFLDFNDAWTAHLSPTHRQRKTTNPQNNHVTSVQL